MAERVDLSTLRSLLVPALGALSVAVAVLVHREEPWPTIHREVPVVDYRKVEEAKPWHDPFAALVAGREGVQKVDITRDFERVLLLMTPRGNSSEYVEWRLRVRHALHVAATSSGYRAENPGKAEYVELPSFRRHKTTWVEVAFRALSLPIPILPEPADASPAIRLAAEVFQPIGDDAAVTAALAIWVPEDEGLGAAIKACTDRFGTVKPVVIGPAVSEGLATEDRHARILQGMSVFSPWATALQGRLKVRSFLEPDSVLARHLAGELQLRIHGLRRDVLIVAERDSHYANRWVNALSGQLGEPQREGCIGRTRVIWYSRGIEGSTSTGDGETAEVAIEKPNGSSTRDYLRRLRLDLLGESLRGTVGAVAIFGHDVADKLTILEALRPVFPEATFVTSDMDAIYLHPDFLPYTRNLVVASACGLTPPLDWVEAHEKESIPPFRDNYQAAGYMAMCAALGIAVGEAPPLPRVFEIGASGPVAMDEPRGRFARLKALGSLVAVLVGAFLLHWWLLGKGLAETGKSIVGLEAWWWWAIGWLGLLGAGVVYGMLWEAEPVAIWSGVSVWPTEVLRLFALSTSLVFAWHVHDRLPRQTDIEPIAWVAVEVVRESFAIFVQKGSAVLQDLRGRGIWVARLARVLLFPAILLGAIGHAVGLVWDQRKRAASHERERFVVSAAVLSLLFFAIAALWMVSTDSFPKAPVRGTYTFLLDICIVCSCVLAMLWLVFLVIESARCQAVVSREQAECVAGQEPIAGDADDAQFSAAMVGWLGWRQKLVELAHAGGRGIYGPFVVLFLMCLSRWSVFDRWSWPMGLVLVICICIACVVLAHVNLHAAAMRYRDSVVASLDVLVGRLAVLPGQRERRERVEWLRDSVRGIDHGIFAGLANHPVVHALLIPIGGVGGLSALHWLPVG